MLVKRGLKKFLPTMRSVTPPWRTVASGLMLLAKPGSLSRAYAALARLTMPDEIVDVSEPDKVSEVTSDTLSGSLTSTISSGMVNLARAAYARDNEPGLANSINPEATVRQGGVTDLIVGRNFFSPRFTNIHRGEAGDTLSLTHER